MPKHAAQLDAQDELARYRDEFVIADSNLIYLDGNSLGRLPKRTVVRLREVVEHEWGERLIRGWNDGWFTAAQRIGAKIARLIGALPDEVIVADSTSVNLFKLVVAAIGLQSDRRTIVTDALNFPSDLYVMEGACRLASADHRVLIVPSHDGVTVSNDALQAVMDKSTALVTLTHTAFKSGFVYDMPHVTRCAHEAGALVLWDLSHSVGAMPLDLNAAAVDLAVGCTYKYLHGGPGAPAFLYVRRALQQELANPIHGWFAHCDPFAFSMQYQPAGDIRRFLCGTPPIVSLAGIEPGVDLVLEAGIDRIRAKSIALSTLLIDLWQEYLAPLGVALNSPGPPAQRGSHVSFGHPDAPRIARALIEEMGVIPDFRRPDNIRFGLSPLYTSYGDVQEAVMRFRRVLVERIFERYSAVQSGVT